MDGCHSMQADLLRWTARGLDEVAGGGSSGSGRAHTFSGVGGADSSSQPPGPFGLGAAVVVSTQAGSSPPGPPAALRSPKDHGLPGATSSHTNPPAEDLAKPWLGEPHGCSACLSAARARRTRPLQARPH